jgi:hypothetical protein
MRPALNLVMKFARAFALSVVLLAPIASRAIAQSSTPASASLLSPRAVAFSELKPASAWRNVGCATAEACFETALWAQATGNLDVLASVLVFDDQARVKAEAAFGALAAEDKRTFGTAERWLASLMPRRTSVAAYKMLGLVRDPSEPEKAVVHGLLRYDDGRVRESKSWVLRHTPDGWRHAVSARFVDQMTKRGSDTDRRTSLPAAVAPAGPATTARAPVAAGMVAMSSLQNRGNATALAAIETMFWAKVRGDYATLEQVIAVKPEDHARLAAKWERLSASSRALMPQITNLDRYAISTWLTSMPDPEIGIVVETQTELAADRIYFTGRRQTERAGSNFDLVLTRTESGWKWFAGQLWAPLVQRNL